MNHHERHLAEVMYEHPERVLDLGHAHWLMFTRWDPDLELNPQFDTPEFDPPVERVGAQVYHRRRDGRMCVGAIHFDTPGSPFTNARNAWHVVTWEPLTVEPSLLCKMPLRFIDGSQGTCGDHGFIRAGVWVPV